MRRTVTFVALLTVFSLLALAESWNGRLIDATCYDQQKNVAACGITASTAAFALEVTGAVYTFDQAGNAKAAEALRSRADRSRDPGAAKESARVMAKVNGTKEGNLLKVETIEVQ